MKFPSNPIALGVIGIFLELVLWGVGLDHESFPGLGLTVLIRKGESPI